MTKPPGDRARYSLALLGFYASCAAVSGGAAMFFFASFVLAKAAYGPLPTVLQVVGGVLILAGTPGAFLCLSQARKPKEPGVTGRQAMKSAHQPDPGTRKPRRIH